MSLFSQERHLDLEDNVNSGEFQDSKDRRDNDDRQDIRGVPEYRGLARAGVCGPARRLLPALRPPP